MRFVFLFSYVPVFYQNMCLNNEVSNSKEIVYVICFLIFLCLCLLPEYVSEQRSFKLKGDCL